MPSYQAPREEYRFILHDFLRLNQFSDLKNFKDVSPDLINAIIEEGAKLTENILQPLNMSGDEEGCHWEEGVVIPPKGFKEAYQKYVEGEWQALCGAPEYGGQGLPQVLGIVMTEMTVSANWGFAMYMALTKGAIDTIHTYGTEKQKQTYLPKMMTGEWPGTMNLTEAHCGTDLGLLRTKAEVGLNGTYKITGSKIFISSGEHDMTSNIIHLVLARTPGAPRGIKGISLFIVPKILVKENGHLGDKNNVSCGAIEKKRGIHGNATCVMNYDGATGYLVGEENSGMKAMFTMMNEARLLVAVQGLGVAEVAQQNAAVYARDRLQGRALTGVKSPDQQADPIIVHPDVRRMLMNNRAFIEGARAFALWTGLQIDISHYAVDEKERQVASDLVSLLTPVLKSYFTDQGVEVASRALQCFGGHGYVKEWGMEQFFRDARIGPIYEGTNGVQAMDLVGRKLSANNGRAIYSYFAMVQNFIDEEIKNPQLANYIKPLDNSFQELREASQWLLDNSKREPNINGSAAHYYLNLMALVTMGYFWARMVRTAQRKIQEGCDNGDFMKNKQITADHFFAYILPDTTSLLRKVKAGPESIMSLASEDF